MDVNHVDGEHEKKRQIRSIFSIFSNLFSEKGRDGKQFVSLLNSITDKNVTLGSESNLQYSLKRFVRGISSAQLHPQCASFAALSCLLKYEQVSAEQILEVLDKEGQGNLTKTEQGGLNSGCVLICGVIIQSGVFRNLSAQTRETVLKKLMTAGKTKSYLSSNTYRFLADLVSNTNEEDFKSVIWPVCKEEIKSSLKDQNIHAYNFLFVCHCKFPKVVCKFIEKHESSNQLFIEKIVKILVNTSLDYDEPYEIVSQFLVENKELLLQLWTDCVNNGNSSKPYKDKSIITLFYFILKNLDDEKLIPKLLLPKFVDTIIMILSFRKTRKLEDIDCHTLAKSSLDILVNSLIKEGVSNSVRFKTIEKLMFYPANMKFERKTGTKCIQSLIMHLNANSLKQLTNIHNNIILGSLKKIVDADGSQEDWNNNEKQYVLHMFVKFLHHPSVKLEKEWKLEQIKFLFDAGFINHFKLHSSVQKCARDCFYKAVEIQMPNVEDVVDLLGQLVTHINDEVQGGTVVLDERVKKSWEIIFSTVQEMKKSKEKLFIAIHLFLIHMGLQLFSDSNIAIVDIEELLACYKRLKEMHKSKEKEEENLHWSEVTVDLMLSLLSRENKLWRYVVCNLVFPYMVKYITPQALHQIIDVLSPQAGDNSILTDHLSDASDDGEGDEEEGEEEDEEKEDEEKEESSLTESENDENITLNDQLRLAVKNALGMSAALTDQESVDMDEMDEEEERKLNERLSAAFKMFRYNSGKQSKKQTKEEKALTHFRFRVLDLVEKYVTNGPSVNGCLDLLFPLFSLLELSIKDPNQRILYNRVDSILKKLSGLKKFPDAENITEALILDHFGMLLSRKEAPSMIFVEMSPRISDCCTFLVRCSQMIPNSNVESALVENYNTLLDNFFHSRDNKLPLALFQSVLRSVWNGSWKLVPTLFGFLVDSTIKIFKKMKVIELLDVFYKNGKLHASRDESMKNRLNQIENQFVENFIEYLSCYEGKKTNEKMFLAFFTKILSLIQLANQSFKNHRQESKKPPKWKHLILKMAEVDIVLMNKKSRKELSRLASLFDVNLPSMEVQKARQRSVSESSSQQDEANGVGEPEEVPERKRKSRITAEKAKLKKHSLKLREEMGSYGIDVIPFSTVDVYSIPDYDEESPPKPKKQKAFNGDASSD